MKRRDFITLLGGAAAAWPLAAGAQQAARPLVAFLGSGTLDAYAAYLAGFRRGLSEGGFADGPNARIEYRWAEGKYDRMSALLNELVLLRPAAIAVTGSTAAAQAAMAATAAIPIVFVVGADPVKFGLVASLNRPGGNVTGVSFLANLLVPKQLEVLHELVPTARTIGFMVNPNNPNAEPDTDAARRAADQLGFELLVLSAASADDIDAAFITLIQQRASALLISPDPLFTGRRDQIVELAMRKAMPTVYNSREYASAGGLLSYGPDQADAYRQAGVYVARILKGEKPSNLPVVQPTKFELVINMKTAKTLGLEVPPTLVARADEVIE